MGKQTLGQNRVNFLKFLGTAGARFVMINQLRSSGGIWVNSGGTNVIIDPGPGSIVRCANSRPKLDPSKLDAVILSHRHLDHSGDTNVMIEAMTEGGFKKRGRVFCPSDTIKRDNVILKYAQKLPQKIQLIKAGSKYRVGEFAFSTSMRHIHSAETYGFKFRINRATVALLTDTRYFDRLEDFYRSEILIMSVAFYHLRPEFDHLSLSDAELLINRLKPKQAIITHFGMSMLKARPHLQAEILARKTGRDVRAAYDGMTLHFS